MQKMWGYRTCTRGIATWTGASAYVEQRVTRGADVTRGLIIYMYLYIFYIVYKSPYYREKIIKSPYSSYYLYVLFTFIFSKWD